MRVFRQEVIDRKYLDLFQGSDDSFHTRPLVVDTVNNHGLFQDALNGHERRHSPIGVLLDIPHLGAVLFDNAGFHVTDTLALEQNLAVCGSIQSEDGFHQARVTAAAFAYYGNCLAVMQVKIHPVHSMDVPGGSKPKPS